MTGEGDDQALTLTLDSAGRDFMLQSQYNHRLSEHAVTPYGSIRPINALTPTPPRSGMKVFRVIGYENGRSLQKSTMGTTIVM